MRLSITREVLHVKLHFVLHVNNIFFFTKHQKLKSYVKITLMKNTNMKTDFQTIGLVLRKGKNLKKEYEKIKNAFLKFNAQVVLDKESAETIGVDGVSEDELYKISDLIISLGGDGTLLGVCRTSYKYQKPILGIHAGTLGFLTALQTYEIEDFIQNLYAGEYMIDERMLLKAILVKDGKEVIKSVAFNEVVFSRASISATAKIEAYADGEHFNSYYGDGLILSTPNGSTAYNLSAGGPIVLPQTPALIITPICPHSLTQRPLVMFKEHEITLSSKDDTVIVVDGQETYNMNDFDSLKVTFSKYTINLVCKKEQNFFKTLKDKLQWGSRE
ncbi:MAG: NAD(+)/NADH kinase [Campylobacteraceae bacterium]